MRELPGIVLTGAFMMLLPPVLAFTLCKKLVAQIGWIRYSVVILHLIVMAGMLIKMVLRWTINLKYVIFIPEYFFNI